MNLRESGKLKEVVGKKLEEEMPINANVLITSVFNLHQESNSGQ
jgi:hypothetical protein